MTPAAESPREPDVRLRPVSDDDELFLLSVYASARAAEMALVPWSEEQRAAFLKMQFAAQQTHYRHEFPKARHDLILLGDQPVGRLYVDRRPEEIRILDITVLPAYRNRGIGAGLVQELMEEAAHASPPQSVSIHVETYNPSHRLFGRLGYRPIENDGINVLLEWRPGQAQTPDA